MSELEQLKAEIIKKDADTANTIGLLNKQIQYLSEWNSRLEANQEEIQKSLNALKTH